MVIESTSVGYLAAGRVNGGFAIWRSDDFATFTPLYNEVCCDRFIRPSAVAEFRGSLLIGGSGRVNQPDGSEIERAFLMRSDDRGRTWTSIEDPVFSERTRRIDSIDVVGGAVIVDAIDDECCGEPTSHAVRSTDLVDFEPLVLPSREADDWPYFQSDDDQIIAVSSRDDPTEAAGAKYVVWRSVDEGRTFTSLPDASLDGRGVWLVAGKLLQIPDHYQDTERHLDATGIRIAEPGQQFVESPPDVGQWGDGSTGFGPVSKADDASYAVVGRELRASPHYCYDDAATCQRSDGALVVTDNGVDWFDVAGLSLDSFRGFDVDVRGDGGIFVWAITGNEQSVTGYRWIGPDTPRRIDPAGYAPPVIPVPLYEHGDPVPVGSTFRYVLGTGFCGGMYVDDQRWAPISPLPDPVPAAWPYQDVGFEDGPEGYIFGRIDRLAVDEISFSIEGLGAVATFRPAPAPTEFCG